MELTMSHEAVELELYATNDGTFNRQRLQPIYVNLTKRMKAGYYDRSKAIEFVSVALREAAKSYCREFGTEADAFQVFTPEIRREVAISLLESLEDEFKLGNWS